jgi:methionyl-tRNA synthetase
MVGRYNSERANNLGNLVSRVSAVVASKCGGVGPVPSPAGRSRLAGVAADVVAEARAAWAGFAPQDALEATWRLIRAANAELEAVEPWKREPGAEVDAVLGDALEVLRIVAVLVAPVLIETAGEIWRRIGVPGSPSAPGNAAEPGVLSWGGYPGGVTVEKGAPLFPRRAVEE